jgi:uncharacterized membrane protein
LRKIARYLLSAGFLISGVAHFRATAEFAAIVPDALPDPTLLVYLSGAAELLLAVLLFVPRLRALAAIGLILLMLAVWPANWNMALHAERFPEAGATLLWLRVVLQVPMVFWALYAGGLWPRASRAPARSESP